MATVSYRLDKAKNKNGKYTVRLVVRHCRTQSTLATSVAVSKSEWLNKSQCIKSGYPDAMRYNEELSQLIQTVRDAIHDLHVKGRLEKMKASEIISYAKSFNKDFATEWGDSDFAEYWQGIAMLHPKSATKYKNALQKYLDFYATMYEIYKVTFKEITAERIRQYISFLKEVPYCPNGDISKGYKNYTDDTVYTYVSTLKAVLNCAIDDDRLSANVMKGFKKVEIKQPTKKEIYALTMEQLIEIYRFDLSHYADSVRIARDLFIFSFCLQGMNLTDIFKLSQKNWDRDDRTITYIRSKTGKTIKLKLTREQDIARLCKPYTPKYNIWGDKDPNSYGGNKPLFAFSYHYSSYGNFKSLILKAIRQLRKIFNLSDNFTFYTARDSWATIASVDYDLGQEYVDAGLGHSSKSLAVNHYIHLDMDKITTVHAKMLDKLFGDK